jgi:hypothetical protein
MSKKKLPDGERKEKFTISINPELFKIVDESISNKSKYIEKLIYKDLLKNKKIDETFEL